MTEPKYHRRQPRPRDVIESLLHQGVVIRCFRTKARVTLKNFRDLEREHLVELALKKTAAEKAVVDTPEYWRWSFSVAHAKVTNGTKATSAGSSKHRIGKMKRLEKARETITLTKIDLSPIPEAAHHLPPGFAFAKEMTLAEAKERWPSAPKPKRGFRKDLTKKMNGAVVARKAKGATRT